MYRLTDLPLVTEWIDDPAQPPTVLIGHLGCRRGTGRDGLREHHIRIIDHQQSPACRAADRLRTETWSVRSAGRDPERGVPDRQLRDDLIPIPDSVQNRGPKGRLVERDSRRYALDPQFRLDICHAGAA